MKLQKNRGSVIAAVTALVIIAAVLVSVIVINGSAGFGTPRKLAELYKDAEFNEIYSAVKSVDVFENMDLELYALFAKKLADEDPDVFAALLKENKDDPVLERTIISVADHNDVEIPVQAVKRLLRNKKIDSDVRLEALFYCSDMGGEYVDLILNEVDDDDNASFALRELYSHDPERAVLIADTVIAEYDGEYTKKLQGALHVKAFALNKSSTSDERLEYIKFCETVMDGALKTDDVSRRYVLNLISSIDSWETLSYLVDNEEFTHKPSLIWDRNTIIGILGDSPDVEKLSVVLDLLNEYPEPDYLVVLGDNISRNAGFYSEHADLLEKAKTAYDGIADEKAQRELNQKAAEELYSKEAENNG